jgi:hypothetical protein
MNPAILVFHLCSSESENAYLTARELHFFRILRFNRLSL